MENDSNLPRSGPQDNRKNITSAIHSAWLAHPKHTQDSYLYVLKT